jgi:hypothetical protein
MKGTLKALTLGAAITMAGCSSMIEVPERAEYAEPDWYADCAESGVEGFLWFEREYAYACGGGQSKYFQASEEQMYAIAMNQFAKRINGVINSETTIDIVNNEKNTRTTISYNVNDTAIREHIAHERAKFKYQGEYYTFVKLKMDKEIFDGLLQEAKDKRVAQAKAQ